MNKLITAASLAAMLVGTAPAFAQSTIKDRKGVVTTTQIEKSGKQIEKITCREFLSLDNRFQPQAVSRAVGYTKANRPEEAVFDVTGIDRLTPVVVKSCKTRPQETLMQRIRAEWHRL